MIRAKFSREIFYNEENGFCVYLYKQINTTEVNSPVVNGKTFSASGYFLPNTQMEVLLDGTWQKYRNKDTYNVDSYKEQLPSDEDSLVKYLSSGLIKGVGKVLAKRIVKKFGMDTLKILDNDIEKLLEIRGISPKKLEKIKESYTNTKVAKDYILYFAKFGISPNTAGKIYRRIKAPLYEIKKNPYMLCAIKGISFLTADKIASANKLHRAMPERISACIDYLLHKEENCGNCGAKSYAILDRATSLLKIDRQTVVNVLNDEVKAERIVSFNGYLYRKSTYTIETEAAKEIIRLKHALIKTIPEIDKKIMEWEKKNGLTLDTCQKNAIKTALHSGFSIITGGPGCGKTTILKCVLDIRQGANKGEAELLAPTGRASKRLAEATNHKASTIHSKCQILDVENHEAEKDLIDADQLLVDESSMIDIFVLCKLLQSVKTGCAVTLIGDPEQLPSVGAGSILRDIIQSGVVPTITLDTIHRQKGESTIVVNATNMRKGISDIKLANDFMLHNVMENDFETSAKKMIDLYKQKVSEYGQDNVCILSPHHHTDTDTSVDCMNKALQKEFNHNAGMVVEYRQQIFKVGDLVMQTVNKNEISNGDIGYIQSIYKNDDGKKCISVHYDKYTFYDYEPDEYDMLELAYAMTIHKSQGSEYQCIIMNLLLAHGIMLKRNLIYTGITRAKKEVHIVGTMDAIKKAVDREDTTVRVTLLEQKLRVVEKNYNPLEEAV